MAEWMPTSEGEKEIGEIVEFHVSADQIPNPPSDTPSRRGARAVAGRFDRTSSNSAE